MTFPAAMASTPLLSHETQLLLALAVAACGWGLRSRLPAGVGLGWAMLAVAGAALLLINNGVDPAGGRARVVYTLGGLSVLYLLAAQYLSAPATAAGWVLGEPRGGRAAGGEDRCREVEVLLIGGLFAALVCAAVGLAEAVSAQAGGLALERFVATIFIVTLVAAALPVWSGPAQRAYCAGGGALLVAATGLQLAPITGLADQWPWLLLAAALATLAAACADVLRGWWRRRQSWLAAPAAAAEISRPVHGLAAAEIVIGALLLGSLLVAPQAAVLPLALALAALGVLTTAHRLGSAALGEFGLVLVAGATLAAGRAWGSPTLRGWLFGALLAAIHMLWLARFWQQQLHQGCAWTSAGRLIPAARRVCLALTALAVAVCTYELLNRSTVDAAPRGILDVWIALALLVLTSLLVRDAASGGEGSAGFACLAALALTARLTELPGVDIAQPPLLVLVAAAVSLLALRVALARETGPDQPVYNALVGGVLPALLTASALHRGIDSVWLGSAILAVGAWMLGTLRSRRDPRGIDHTITAGQV